MGRANRLLRAAPQHPFHGEPGEQPEAEEQAQGKHVERVARYRKLGLHERAHVGEVGRVG